jgi:molybdate transport system permease protein
VRPRRPPPLVVPAVVGLVFLLLPLLGLLARAPWSSLPHLLTQPGVGQALRLSLVCATLATLLSLVLGVPLAWVLARLHFAGIGLLRAVVAIPLVLPPVIGGVALFNAFGRTGILGSAIHAVTGTDLPFSYPSIVVAQVFVAMPFLVVTVEGAFRTADRGVEEAAATLGASRMRIFARVTVPLIVPSIVAGAVLCWARALGEFGATLLIGGNVAGVTQTLPTLVLTLFETHPEDAPSLGLPLIAVAVLVLGALRDRWLRTPAVS